MMNYTFPFSTALFLCSNVSFAGENSNVSNLGVGLSSGTITNGITAKKYFKSNMAVQAFMSTKGFIYHHTFSIGADALFEFTFREIGLGRIFYGYGGGLALFSHRRIGFSGIGFSGVGELGIHLSSIPLEVIIDVRPSIILGEQGGLHLPSGGAAVRWFF